MNTYKVVLKTDNNGYYERTITAPNEDRAADLALEQIQSEGCTDKLFVYQVIDIVYNTHSQR